MPKEPMLTTHDLKERGWTLSMIRKLLPEHDGTRENLLDPRYGDVKLYLESRVLEAESTGAYAELLDRALEAQERGSKAQETRKSNLEAQMQQAVADYHPNLEPLDAAYLEKFTPTQRPGRVWVHHLSELDTYYNTVLDSEQMPRRMSRVDRNRLWELLKVPHMEALKAAYSDVVFPW